MGNPDTSRYQRKKVSKLDDMTIPNLDAGLLMIIILKWLAVYLLMKELEFCSSVNIPLRQNSYWNKFYCSISRAGLIRDYVREESLQNLWNRPKASRKAIFHSSSFRKGHSNPFQDVTFKLSSWMNRAVCYRKESYDNLILDPHLTELWEINSHCL